MSFTRDELRPLDILEGLPDEQLDWLCEHGERITLDSGDHMFDRGQVADALWIAIADNNRIFNHRFTPTTDKQQRVLLLAVCQLPTDLWSVVP